LLKYALKPDIVEPHLPEPADNCFAMLDVYLLGRVDFEALLALQRRLVYEVSGRRDRAALILCEHDPLITVGRQGSRTQIHFDSNELRLKGWPIRWVNRGGGCLFHAPGQLALYAILPLDRLGLDVSAYLDQLRSVFLDVAADAGIKNAASDENGVTIGDRLVAHLGVAVRDWVSYFGGVLNINPDLDPFRRVNCGGLTEPMTSLERERRLAVNPTLVQQRVVERFMERFNLPRVTVHHEHPALPAALPRAPKLPAAKTFIVLRSMLDPI
jgi:lipoyl(octanoyl) transferase